MPFRNRLLIAACMLAIPVSARAQRAATVAFQARNDAVVRRVEVRGSPGGMQAVSDTAHADSHAVALGALAGAIVGAWYGHGDGGNCDGSGDTQAHCRQTLLIGGTAVGAVLGALAGHLVELGEERDARRAAARARADSASTPSPAHP